MHKLAESTLVLTSIHAPSFAEPSDVLAVDHCLRAHWVLSPSLLIFRHPRLCGVDHRWICGAGRTLRGMVQKPVVVTTWGPLGPVPAYARCPRLPTIQFAAAALGKHAAPIQGTRHNVIPAWAGRVRWMCVAFTAATSYKLPATTYHANAAPVHPMTPRLPQAAVESLTGYSCPLTTACKDVHGLYSTCDLSRPLEWRSHSHLIYPESDASSCEAATHNCAPTHPMNTALCGRRTLEAQLQRLDVAAVDLWILNSFIREQCSVEDTMAVVKVLDLLPCHSPRALLLMLRR